MADIQALFRSEKALNALVLSVVFLFGVHLLRLYPVVAGKFTTFIQTKGNYDYIRNREVLVHQQNVLDPASGQLKAVTVRFTAAGPWEAAQVIPVDGVVEIAPPEWTMTKAMARYVLYPRAVADEGEGGYALDLMHVYPRPPEGAKGARLPSGAVVYAKAGHEFEKTAPVKPIGWARLALFALCTGVVYAVIGFFVCGLLSIPLRPGGILWFASTCYLIGFFVLSAEGWLIKISVLPFTRASLSTAWLLTAAVLFFCARGRLRAYGRELGDHIREIEKDWQNRTVPFAAAGMYFVIFILFLSIAFSPVLDWDGMLHWAYLAKVMAFEEELRFPYPHLSYYPLLWPAHMAAHFILQQSYYDGVLSWLMAVNFLALAGQFTGCVRILKVSPRYFWLPLMVYIVYFYKAFFYFTYAEVIFTAFELGVVAGFLLWAGDKEKRGHFMLALIMACALAIVKLEGVFSVLCLAVAAAIGYNPGSKTRFFGFFALPAVFIAAWILWVKCNGHLIPVSHVEKGLGAEKIGLYFQLLAAHIQNIRPEKTGLLLIIGVTVLLRKAPMGRDAVFLLASFVLLFIFSYLAVLGVYPERLAEQIERATPRLVFHAAPLLCLWWAALLPRLNTPD